MALVVGQLVGNYTIVRLIGEGGFGEVYLAENPLIERRVAVKVLRAALVQDAESVRRFLNEARAASAIRHPNIIEVLDAGRLTYGQPYIVMEFLDGVPLQRRLADVGRLPLPKVLDIAKQAGAALAAAHNTGIVHRDLKPENLFLIPDGCGGELVKVLDFGIAKMQQGTMAASAVHTKAGFIMGSPTYMSPEQCRNSADVDLRSDIYSFGTMLYEMIAGCPPFISTNAAEMIAKQLSESPPPLRALVTDIPAYLDAAIMRSLAKGREDRFDSVTGFLSALRLTTQRTGLGTESQSAMGTPSAPAEGRLFGAGRVAESRHNTTFSRSSGEVAGIPTEEASIRVMLSLRVIAVVMGVAVVAGLVVLLLVRPGSEQWSRTELGGTTAASSLVIDAAPLPMVATPTATPLAAKADAGPVPPEPALGPTTKRPPAWLTHPATNRGGATAKVHNETKPRRPPAGGSSTTSTTQSDPTRVTGF